MARYPKEKYTIITHQHKDYLGTETIAFSTYAGKPVYGKAICRTEDTYDEQTGKKLAVARCAHKISIKRRARAGKLLEDARRQLATAQKYVENMTHYYNDACAEVNETAEELAEIYNSL